MRPILQKADKQILYSGCSASGAALPQGLGGFPRFQVNYRRIEVLGRFANGCATPRHFPCGVRLKTTNHCLVTENFLNITVMPSVCGFPFDSPWRDAALIKIAGDGALALTFEGSCENFSNQAGTIRDQLENTLFI